MKKNCWLTPAAETLSLRCYQQIQTGDQLGRGDTDSRWLARLAGGVRPRGPLHAHLSPGDEELLRVRRAREGVQNVGQRDRHHRLFHRLPHHGRQSQGASSCMRVRALAVSLFIAFV